MATRNALAAGSTGGRRGRMSFDMLIQILQTRKAIRESGTRRRRRLAEIEAETVGQIGAKRGRNIRQIGVAGAQTRRDIGGIQAQNMLTQANVRTNMLGGLLNIVPGMIEAWPQRGARVPGSAAGGAAPVTSNIFARYTGR